MFSYYGNKFRLARYYPKPNYNIIIEPFAGAAWYSLIYYSKNIHLNDKYSIISDIWKYIINLTEKEINDFPQLKRKEDLRKFNLSEDTRKLLGFAVNYGTSFPGNICTEWASRDNAINTLKKRLIKYCNKIKHWKITNLDYKDLENIEATWFVDPPYQFGGEHYIHSNKNINYKKLADWCKSRKGQIIVCENSKADWLDFRYFRKAYGQRHETHEVIWTK